MTINYPTDWSPDGKYILYTVGFLPRADVFALRLADGKSIPFLTSEFTGGLAKFSPDGRWVAYMSTESGTNEVYVRPFSVNSDGTLASAAGKWMLPKGSGNFPNWRRDGKKLFYLGPGNVSAVDVLMDKTIEAGIPARLFPVPVAGSTDIGGGDISRDGTQFWFVAFGSSLPRNVRPASAIHRSVELAGRAQVIRSRSRPTSQCAAQPWCHILRVYRVRLPS
jgi:hypothetical protein